MNLNDFPFTESITAVIAATIGWFTGGKLNAKSKEISNTAELIALWKDANHDCRAELDLMREDIRTFRLQAAEERQRADDEISKLQQQVKVLQAHIKKLESK